VIFFLRNSNIRHKKAPIKGQKLKVFYKKMDTVINSKLLCLKIKKIFNNLFYKQIVDLMYQVNNERMMEFKVVRAILYYLILSIILIISTLYLPIYLYKDYEKHDYWYLEMGKYYTSIKYVVGMFIL